MGSGIIERVNPFADPGRLDRRRKPARGRPPARHRDRGPLLLALPLVGLALLAAACGGSPGSGVARLASTTTTTATDAATQSSGSTAVSVEPVHLDGARAFSRCMRSHGVPAFPDPDSDGGFPALSQQALGVSKQTSLAAQEACGHLLSSGGGPGTPGGRQEKLAFGLKVAQCLRRHGFPDFPDPNGSNQGLPPGLDPNSPQFQANESRCEKQARQALGLR